MSNLKELRRFLGLTQEDVARAVGKSKASISGYERGKVVPPEHIRRWLEYQQNFRKKFEKGRIYNIDKYDFEYLRDEGIHHIFIARPGDWIRTYTDAQLTEKKITEGEGEKWNTEQR